MRNKLSLAIIFSVFLFGCDSLLDPYPYGQVDDEEMEKFQKYVSGLVGYAYEQIPRNYMTIEGNRLDCTTDDAVLTSVNDQVVKFATGRSNNSQDPFSGVWSSSYKAIANINIFLEDNLGLNTKYYLDPEIDQVYKERLQGEAYGMRAFMEWRLLKLWGGRGIKSGKLLGVPVITDRVTTESDKIYYERKTYEECVAQIINDCESAYNLLPIAHRDFLYDSEYLLSFQKVLGSCNWGRIDGITTRAILADMYLTYASPLFNPGGDMERWKKAAEYAKEVMDFKLNTDNVSGGFVWSNRLDWFDACSPNSIFVSRRYGNSDANDEHEKEFYPVGFRGDGVLGATHDLVDAFPMSNGYPKEHPEGQKLYDPNNPYANRDPRLYSAIFYPGSTNKHDYTFETWYDETSGKWGKDAPGLVKVSRTGYHIRKMVYPDLDWSAANVYKGPHVKHYYRWEHMVLAFAEAANEYTKDPNNSTVFGISAKDALKYLRSRKTYDGQAIYADADPYLEEAAQNYETFRELVHNERRIELCFEGQRFFDIRRWATDVSEINKPVHKINVTKKTDGTFVYEVQEVENREFPSLFIPIPYDEILKDDNLEQNEGWNTWSK